MPSITSQEKSTNIKHILPWVMCGLAALFYCYEYVLRIMPSVMIPDLMSYYGITFDAVSFLSAYYYVGYTPMQFPVGIMMDKYGPRRILTVAVVCCAFGSTIMGMGVPYHIALIGRFFVGFGSAFAFVGVLKLATIWLPPNRFGLVAGATTALGMFGAMTGQNALKVLVDKVGWEQTVLVSGLFGIVLVPIIWCVVRDAPKGCQIHQEYRNNLTFAKMIRDIGRMFTNKQLWVNGCIGSLIMLPTTIFAELLGSTYIELYYKTSSTKATFIASLIFLGWAIGGPISGFISDKLHRRRLPLTVGSLMAFLIMLYIIYFPPISITSIYIAMILFGLFSSVQVLVFAVARENTPEQMAGTAVAMTNFIVVMAGFCQWMVGKFLDTMWDGTVLHGHPYYSVQNFQTAFLLLPAGILAAFTLTLFLNETYCKPVHERETKDLGGHA